MIRKTFISYAAAAAAILMPLAASATVTPVDLPDGISSVDPPQGYVDLSNNANPLGVQQISVFFQSSDLEANPNAKGDVVLYKDASDTVYDSVPATAATVDQYTHQFGSIIFEHKHTAEGVYTVVIPEGTWLVDGNNSPEIKLNYEIRQETTISPAAGLVDALDNVSITFNLAEKVELVSNNIVAAATGSTEDCKVEVTINGNVVELAISNSDGSALGKGSYDLFIPASTFKLISTENGEEVVSYNKTIMLKYDVPAFPKLPITPEEGEVTGFKSFTISADYGYSIWMVDDKTRSYIYSVDEDGNLAADASYKLLAKYNTDGTIQLNVLDSSWNPVEEPVVPAPGRYALVLANALLSGDYNGDFVSTPSYVYYYDVVESSTGIQVIKVESSPIGDVYNLSGVKVAHGAAQMRQLPAGVYIVNGMKIVKK
jgi:hypothetical protein